MPRYIIDRFEGTDWAVLEDERARSFNVPRQWLPSNAREGDVVQASEHEAGVATKSLRFELDPAARDAQLTNVRQLRERLPRAPKGDVSL